MNRFLRGLLKSVLPQSVEDSWKLAAKARSAIHVDHELSQIPCDLKPIHVANTRLYANREELLKSFQRDGTVIEIGVSQGEFSKTIWQTMHPRHLHLVDIWQSSDPVYGQAAYEGVLARFADQIQNGSVTVHRKGSLEALAELPDNSLDCIYIDADHSYASVKAELQSCVPKMKPDGVIAGHDYIRWSGPSARFGVIEAVNEFCLLHHYEFIGLTLQRNMHLSFAIKPMR